MSTKENSTHSTWGSAQTKFFYELTPEKILTAVEALGFKTTGRVSALNSMENRVYEVEVDADETLVKKNPSEGFRIVKFYRPGRWTREQIAEEHQFLLDLQEYDIPVVAPIAVRDNETLFTVPEIDIRYAVFPKIGGRSPDELDDEQLMRVGRLLARMHNVGQVKAAKHRVRLTPSSYGIENLNYLLRERKLPPHLESRYENVVTQICKISTPWFEEAESQRIHGDCHLGNLLWNNNGPFWVDFDDMVSGPCVQDVWLIMPGRDSYGKAKLAIFLEAYDQLRPFDRRSLRLIEPLRALRFVHFSAWIAKRWEDPSFQRTFVHYESERYWQEQMRDLEEQLALIQEQ